MGFAEDKGWVEVGFYNALGKWTYSEEHGFGILRAREVRFLKDGEPLDQLLFREVQGNQTAFRSVNSLCGRINDGNLSFDRLSSVQCFRRDPRTRGFFSQPYDSVELECARIIPQGCSNAVQAICKNSVFTVRSEEECKKLRFRLVGQALPNPRVQDIREGGRYFYRKPGENRWMDVRVTKVYDFPTTDRACDVLAQDGQTYSLDRSVIFLLTLPLSGLENYQDTPDAGEAAGIDRGVREADLQPHAVREGQTANICWLPIAGAASFRVTLYRRVDVQWPGFVPLYHLADYETDRDTHFLSVSGLVGPGLLYRVTALDRTGNELACSRGRDL